MIDDRGIVGPGHFVDAFLVPFTHLVCTSEQNNTSLPPKDERDARGTTFVERLPVPLKRALPGAPAPAPRATFTKPFADGFHLARLSLRRRFFATPPGSKQENIHAEAGRTGSNLIIILYYFPDVNGFLSILRVDYLHGRIGALCAAVAQSGILSGAPSPQAAVVLYGESGCD